GAAGDRARHSPLPRQPHQGGGPAGHFARHALSQSARPEYSGGRKSMSAQRKFALWAAVACVALVVLILAVRYEYYGTENRFATGVAASPTVGEGIFHDKGCAACHASEVLAAKLGNPTQKADGLPDLVTAMWNHAPRMWEAMKAQNVRYPELSYEEAGQLVSYLYITRWVDEPGDPAHGRELFTERNCSHCHGDDEGPSGPSRKQLARTDDLVLW